MAETIAESLIQCLTLEAIAGVADRPEVRVQVPEWGGAVKIRALSFDQINDARQRAWDTRKRETNEDVLNAYCLAHGMVEPKVSFAVAKQWICDHSFGAVNTILSEILRASGLGAKAQAEAKSATGEQPGA